MNEATDKLFIYRIDAHDRLTFVDQNWFRFAAQNGMRDPNAALGRVMWDNITPDATRDVYRQVYERVRKTQKSETVCFRCDSPTLRRRIELEVHWLADGGLEHRSRIVREEKRASLVLMDPAVPRSQDYLTMCAWCSRVNLQPRWLDPEVVVRVLALGTGAPIPQITHGICPPCADTQLGRRTQAA